MTNKTQEDAPLEAIYDYLAVTMERSRTSAISLDNIASLIPPSDALPPSTLVGNRHVIDYWRRTKSIADVYRSHHKNIPTLTHTLKVLNTAYVNDPVLNDRIHMEASIISRLRSPYAVRLADVGTLPDGRPYLCREYQNGTELHAWMNSTGAVEARAAVMIVVELLIALAELHHHGHIHGGLSPKVIVLIQGVDNRVIQPRIIDFSTLTSTTEQSARALVYTRLKTLATDTTYLAPELMYQYPTPAADIYSAGLLLSRLLYPSHDIAPMGRAIHIHDRGTNNKPTPLTHIIQTATSKAPTARYQSAAAMIEAILEAMQLDDPAFVDALLDNIVPPHQPWLRFSDKFTEKMITNTGQHAVVEDCSEHSEFALEANDTHSVQGHTLVRDLRHTSQPTLRIPKNASASAALVSRQQGHLNADAHSSARSYRELLIVGRIILVLLIVATIAIIMLFAYR